VADPVADLFCTLRTPIPYPLLEQPSWSEGGAYPPFRQLIPEESQKYFAVLNREPGRRIKFNSRGPWAKKRSNIGAQ
jgi:hypothetical protein